MKRKEAATSSHSRRSQPSKAFSDVCEYVFVCACVFVSVFLALFLKPAA